MNATDLLKMCDELLKLSDRAKTGPLSHIGMGAIVDKNGRQVACITGQSSMHGDPSVPAHEIRDATADLIAHSRTALPILASALKGLLPYMDHSDECEQRILDHEDGEPLPCTCGLSSTLSALEGQASRG